MKSRRNKTLRRKLHKKQRSRRHRSYRRFTRRYRQKGGLPVPDGSIVAISTGGELGVPILMTKDQAEELQEKGGL